MQQPFIKVILSARMLADLFDSEEQADAADQEDPPEGLDESAKSHDDSRREWQVHTESSEQVGKNRNDPFEQRANDEDGDADHGHRVDQRRLHGGPQADRLFHVRGETLQDDVENTAGFTGLDHVGREVIENVGVLTHGVGQSRTAFYRGTNARKRLLEGLVFLVGSENLETLHQRQAGIDHDRELPEENGDVLDRNLAGTERRQREFLALFADGAGRDALTAQRLGQRLLVGSHPFAADFLSAGVLARIGKNWHGV